MATSDPAGLRLARSSATVADDIVRQIEHRIVAGSFTPGDRLPAERRLAADLGVSRTALREALGRLEVAGLVVRRHGSGTRVARAVPLGASLAARLENAGDDFDHSAEFRELVEPQLARLAAERITAAELTELRALLAASSADVDAEESLRLDVAFHTAIARASRNPLLASLGELTANWTVEARAFSHLAGDGRRVSHAGHVRILAGLEAADPDAVASAMATHLREIRAVIDRVRDIDQSA
ncbi:MAG: FadR/GntR family transcriptional regulator [Micropruina sp.]|uniref:FadR/GntR family transcriptional regulator n=1 Tax=Micropruina sp. TaxID=2737536 RepID=UPI0039E3B54D